MDWGDERFVKLYTRNTGTWVAIGWEGRFVLMSLLRQVDRAGVLDVSAGEEAETLAALILAPLEVVKPGLERLIARKVVLVGGDKLRWPTFLAAQEAKTSDKIRQQKCRESRALGESLSHGVTFGHTSHTAVTNVTTRLDETRRDKTRQDKVPRETAARAPTVRIRKPKPEKTTDPRHAPLVQALVDACPGYDFAGRDAGAVTKLLAKGEPMEVLIRWRRALARAGFPLVRQIHELATHWNHFATDQPTGKKPSAFAAADRDVEHVVGEIKL